MAIAAGAGAGAIAQDALDTANNAHDTAVAASNTADSAQSDADSAALTAVAAASTASVASSTATLARNLAVQSFEGATLVNGILSTSVTAGALTISILTAAGNTPSVIDAVPVQVTFRDNTATTTVIQVTSAKTITIPSGAEVGVIASKGTRIWVVGLLNNAKTDFELAVMNRMSYTSGTNLRVYTLPDRYLYGNELAVGTISAASDTSGILYTTTITGSGRAIRILGQLMFETGIAVPGTWVTPTNIILQGRGVPGPGSTVNQGFIIRDTKNSVTITTALPIDNTRPLFSTSEFGFYNTIEFTPQSGANVFQIEFDGYVSAPAGSTAADYLAVGVGISNSDWSLLGFNKCNGADIPTMMRMQGMISPPIGGLNQNNLQFGVACTHTGTAVINGVAANSLFGGAGTVIIKVSEIVA